MHGVRITRAPAAAPSSEQQPTRADEDKAAQAYEKAKKVHEAADKTRNDLAAQHARALGAAGAEPVAELQAQLGEARTVHQAAQKEAAELVEAQQRLGELQAEHDRREHQRTQARQQVTESQTRARALLQEQEQIAHELDEARSDAPTLEQRITELTAASDRLAGVIEQVGQTAAAATRHDDALATSHDSAAKAGFPTLEEAADALQPAVTLQQWQ